jgi:hypothetical protein
VSRAKLLGLAILFALGCRLVGCHTHAGAPDERRMCAGGPTYPITVAECERWTVPRPTPLPPGLVERDASVDVGWDAAADASEDAVDSAVAAIETADAARPCTRKGAPSPSAPDHIEIGCSKAEVIAAEGKPSAEEGEVWTYRFPGHCSEIRVTVRVRFANGRVVSVKRESRRTGELCGDAL